jgi:hypothetical protein
VKVYLEAPFGTPLKNPSSTFRRYTENARGKKKGKLRIMETCYGYRQM